VKARVEVAKASIKAPPGKIWILATASGLREVRLSDLPGPSREEGRERGISFVRRPRWTDPARRALERYFEGEEHALDLPLDLDVGTPFQRRVWEAARRVVYGTTASYAQVARLAGSPSAVRAVGNALGANPVPIVVPCHRIIHSDLTLGGFSSGLTWKRFLLEVERGQLEFSWKPRRRLFHSR
jgi:methylated-DNA-[protein]-cysteine S-methyltransferase